MVDGSDYRVVQAPQSGLSFGGSNGRGNAFSIDGAENYVKVHRNLAGHRERFVRMCLPASALYALAQAAPERIEEVAALIEARGDTPFKSLTDLAQRVNPRVLNKRTLENLVAAGALDEDDVPR